MPRICGLILLVLVLLPGAASGQTFALYGSAGPTLRDLGNSIAVGAGFSPRSWLTLAFAAERTHLSSTTERDSLGRIVSSVRGGTMYLGTGEVRFMPLPGAPIRPYGLAGLAGGVSRPTVNARYPDAVTNDVRTIFFGGGLAMPVGPRLTFFGDARLMVGAEGVEGIVAVAPLRGGVAWRF